MRHTRRDGPRPTLVCGAVPLPSPVLTPRTRPAIRTAALGAVLVLAFVLLRLAFATRLGGFVVASADFVDPSATPDRLPVVTDTGGYDGQFVYRLALEPWTTEATAYGIELDTPAYRQQRIATPTLAWAVGLLPGVSTLLALLLVNAGALVVAASYGGRLAVRLGRHPAWGLLLAFPACMPISLGRHLTEPVAWAGVLAGLWYARERRWPAAAVAFSVAVLARESSLVVVAGLAAGEVLAALHTRRASRRPAPGGAGLAWLAVPVTVGLAWQLVLLAVWGSLPLRSGGSGNLGSLPLAGVLGSLLADVPGSAPVQVAVVGARLATLALLAYAGLTLVLRRSRLSGGEAVAWVLAALLALSLRAWSSDVQFLRAANEAVGLSVLVALGDDSRLGRAARLLAAALVLGVAAENAIRQ